ncbi:MULTISPECIES: 4-aminobutyrate--2-oxoglutarate transaminase [Pelosinus]|uniref:(S)-3-amino-2-methylpropionate transaminase n=1 Tax=Pelosinus fermentans B4 TaxID=1149862 RepID=I9AWS8_9FIRM|nr:MULTISPECIES: 4-aminobutyrate--2-oxoglutarate transaminase [Pelosinus]EIW17322.1 4-aminobutyrate aminotransferase [Pelosinus fermentans B4]EIW23381.1 4-aminobutyrate aminotransferase [Pelosinus fermentans A11]OAM96492.1 4-aminobutyrate aminotransferase [Pelosinus fermentans DSM 17108]SDR40739.1 4-aminobutyrate aminotransferase / (S)-3-amino-2-methylpropionate transaminase [Pelosinus fermentans]
MSIAETKTEKLIQRKNNAVARGIANSTGVFVEKASGAVITDVEGREFLDFYAGVGVLNVGHCPEPVVKAVQKQAEQLLHSFFAIAMYEPYVELAEKMNSLMPGGSLKKTMFANSGAEAVENAVKIARHATKRTGIISFEGAFHGRTFMTMSLTSKVKPYKYGFGPFAPETYKVPSAYCYRCHYRTTHPGCGMHCLENFERFFTAEIDAEHIAAMIIEPVQGEGGFIVPPPEFLPGLKAICESKGILFIADEVQTGFGRTGKMFAIENWGVEPDIMTTAKSIAAGMPLSAVTGKAEYMDAPDAGNIGGTYGGNPLACAAGLETIKFIEDNNLCSRAAQIGSTAMKRLKELQERCTVVGDVRGIGAMIGIELVKDRQTKEPAKEITSKVVKYCLEQGVMLISAGIFSNVIRLLIPLVVTDEQLDRGLTVLEQSILRAAKEG